MHVDQTPASHFQDHYAAQQPKWEQVAVDLFEQCGLLVLLCLQLFEKYRGGAAPPKELGPSRDYNVDMVPKFMMARGKLVKALIYTSVTKYLEFKAVDGSYVYNKVGGGCGTGWAGSSWQSVGRRYVCNKAGWGLGWVAGRGRGGGGSPSPVQACMQLHSPASSLQQAYLMPGLAPGTPSLLQLADLIDILCCGCGLHGFHFTVGNLSSPYQALYTKLCHLTAGAVW
jgi:hypothetical protein